jgi:GNAT superfamily N-acetyltransferase
MSICIAPVPSITHITIKPASFREILNAPEANKLFAEYAEECSLPELGHFNPQQAMYQQMENSGLLKCFVVRSGERLVGFAALLLYVLPHYGRKIATTESIFIARAYRTGCAGAELLGFIEAYAKQNGCVAVLYTAPAGSQFDRLLGLTRRHSNNVYVRSLA